MRYLILLLAATALFATPLYAQRAQTWSNPQAVTSYMQARPQAATKALTRALVEIQRQAPEVDVFGTVETAFNAIGDAEDLRAARRALLRSNRYAEDDAVIQAIDSKIRAVDPVENTPQLGSR